MLWFTIFLYSHLADFYEQLQPTIYYIIKYAVYCVLNNIMEPDSMFLEFTQYIYIYIFLEISVC